MSKPYRYSTFSIRTASVKVSPTQYSGPNSIVAGSNLSIVDCKGEGADTTLTNVNNKAIKNESTTALLTCLSQIILDFEKFITSGNAR
jgi:hypothetical protein